MEYAITYRRPGATGTHTSYITAPTAAAAWALFEATHPPRHAVALTLRQLSPELVQSRTG